MRVFFSVADMKFTKAGSSRSVLPCYTHTRGLAHPKEGVENGQIERFFFTGIGCLSKTSFSPKTSDERTSSEDTYSIKKEKRHLMITLWFLEKKLNIGRWH